MRIVRAQVWYRIHITITIFIALPLEVDLEAGRRPADCMQVAHGRMTSQ